MKHEKIADALNEIRDAHIEEAAAAKKRRRPYWIGGVAAVLVLVIIFADIGTPAAQAAGLIASPEYPEMAPRPDESSYGFGSGEFDSDAFAKDFTAWQESQLAQYDQPEGYADNLTDFFLESIPEFLSGAGEENAVYSPLNVYMALAMLAETTGGNSQGQILSLLGTDSIEALREQAGNLWNAHYCADGASSSLLASSLWLDDSVTYKQDTVDILADSYYASVYSGELGSQEMNAALQDWLNQQTGGLLEEQVKGVELSPDTVLALATTIYYSAKWASEFSESRNTEDVFHADSGDMTATFMHKTINGGTYYYGEDYGAIALGLQDGSQMWLVLPDEGYTPEDLLESGNALGYIMNYTSSSENKITLKINLSLPKFDAASSLDLVDGLKNLGVTDVFDPDLSDYSPIVEERGIFLDKADHAARVKIDEEGVEAAAYTVIAYDASSEMPPEEEIDFILDRSFLFVITSRDDLPLFAGIVNQP